MGSRPPGHRLEESIPWNRFRGSIKVSKIPPLFVSRRFFLDQSEEKLMKEQRKTNYSFLYYQRNEDKAKYLFLN
jgi:hypothetical protein